MNKFLILCLSLFLGVLSLARETYLDIDADFFEAKEKKHKLYFKGNVKLRKNKDKLNSKELLINTRASKSNPKKQVPKDYVATGDVKFTIYTTKDSEIKGSGDKVYYYPDDQKYIIVGNGYLEDVKEGKKIYANKIYLDEKTGYTKIDGEKNKPAKFRIKLDEQKKQ